MINDSELLRYALNNDMIDMQSIEKQIEMNERKKYLDMHNHKKWKTKDGKWCTYLPDTTKPNKRALFRRGSEEDIDNLIISYWKGTIDNPTIREVFQEWIDRKLKRGQIKPSTHLVSVQTFNRFYSNIEDRKISSMCENDWEDFLCECIYKYNLTAKAFSNLKGITKGFLKRAKKRGLIRMEVESFFLELDVSDNDFRKKVIDDKKEIFYDDEIELIMDYIKQNPDCRNLGIALMFVTGIRVGELVALKHEDFCGTTFQIKRTETRMRNDESKQYTYYVDDFPKTPAGYRTVIVPSNQSWIVDELVKMNPDSDYIFLDKKNNRMNTVKMRKRLYLICQKVGIPPRSPHKIRKTYGSILLDNGMDQKLIESQMGHTNIACTEEHYHRDRRKINEKQKVFDSIPEFMVI